MAVALLTEPEPVTLTHSLIPRLRAERTPEGRHVWLESNVARSAPAVNRLAVVAIALSGLALSVLALGVGTVLGVPVWLIALTGALVSGYGVKHTDIWPATLIGIAGLTVGALQLVLTIGG